MNTKELHAFFGSEDAIYHYTSMQTAIEYILHTNKLMFSQRKQSKDPIENIIDLNGMHVWSAYPTADFDKLQKYQPEHEQILTELQLRLQQAVQICFCKNSMENAKKDDELHPLEFYGFMKPRMWDQYGDSYKGVCIAFSREKIQATTSDVITKDIKYVHYKELMENIVSVRLDEIELQGYDKYLQTCSNQIDQSFFIKHLDYSGENEYRLLGFVKPSPFPYKFMDITDAITGIFAPNFISSFAKTQLEKYSLEFKIPLVYLHWSKMGVRHTQFKPKP